MITLEKDGKTCKAKLDQVDLMKAAGWSLPGETPVESGSDDSGSEVTGTKAPAKTPVKK